MRRILEYEVKYDSSFYALDPLPTCKFCKEIKEPIRPNILMFGDSEFNETRTSKQEEKYLQFVQEMM